MKYRLGNSIKMFEKGNTVEMECPNCKKEVEFSVFSNRDTKLTNEFPLVKSQNVYLLVCPNCFKSYTVDSLKGKSFEKGEPLSIGYYDLKELKEY